MRLQRFEELLRGSVAALKTRQLHSALRELNRLKPEDCTYVLAAIKPALEHLVRAELVKRDRRRRQQVLALPL